MPLPEIDLVLCQLVDAMPVEVVDDRNLLVHVALEAEQLHFLQPSVNQSINQSINQSVNQSINQLLHWPINRVNLHNYSSVN